MSSREHIIFEYAVEGDYRSPDCTTVAVSAHLFEDAVEYYVERLTEQERLQWLESYIYEDCYEKIKNNGYTDFAIQMVNEYIKDHE